MGLIEALTALATIIGVGYIFFLKLRKKEKGRRFVGGLGRFINPKNLINREDNPIKKVRNKWTPEQKLI